MFLSKKEKKNTDKHKQQQQKKKNNNKHQLQSLPPPFDVLHGPEMISSRGVHLEFPVQILALNFTSYLCDTEMILIDLQCIPNIPVANIPNESWIVAKSLNCAAGNWVEGPVCWSQARFILRYAPKMCLFLLSCRNSLLPWLRWINSSVHSSFQYLSMSLLHQSL